MSNCHCFFTSLGFYYEPDFYSISQDKLKTAYKRASLLCHPDKNPTEKEKANRAQQIINQARIIISNADKCFWYLDSGTPPTEFDHNCKELEPILNFIGNKLRPGSTMPPQPPRPPTPAPASPSATSISTDDEEETNNENNDSNNANTTNNSSSRFDPTYDSDEPSSFWSSPKPSRKEENSSSEKKRKGRRKSVFTPTGYQKQGGTVTMNKQRTQGPVYLMEWAAKPGYSTWLSEEDLVKHFPKEAKEYIERLKRVKSKRLSGIVKKAGPITVFL